MGAATPIMIVGTAVRGGNRHASKPPGDPAYIGKIFPSLEEAGKWVGFKERPSAVRRGKAGHGNNIQNAIRNHGQNPKRWPRIACGGYVWERPSEDAVEFWTKNYPQAETAYPIPNPYESDPAHTCLPPAKPGPIEEKEVTVVKRQRNSEQQAEFRRGCLQLHGDKCAFCGTTENVEAAHITSLKAEDGRNFYSNGLPLCRGVCHPAFDSGRLKWNPDTWHLELVNFPKEGAFVEPHPEAHANIEEAYWHK